VIHVRGLRKHYQVHERPPGIAAAFRSLLRRRYKTVKAVEGLSFHIAEGERVGFLGPNGAGKTTTLKVLAGLLHPTSGEVDVGGHEPRRREDAFLRSIMLVLGQKQQLLWDLPPSETFELNRAVYDVPRAQYEETLRELTDLLELGDLVKKPSRTLSLGERMKCELAAALIHRPRVLFLDEPTTVLDPQSRLFLWDTIEQLRAEGVTQLLTTHDMLEADRLCDRIAIVDHGSIIALDTPRALRRLLPAQQGLDLVLEARADPGAALAGLPGVTRVTANDAGDGRWRARLYGAGEGLVEAAVAAASAGGMEVAELRRIEGTLEDVFVHLTGRELR
jgi:ABC-2 type transport system ATP-binding protein